MYMSLFLLGVIVTATGAAMVGFGIPINEFGLGNTLIVAGTTAFVGGLILIGLADAVRQLRRIADSLMARPTSRPFRPLDPFEPEAASASPAGSEPGRIPFPPKPEGRGRASAPFEPRLDSALSIDAAKDSPFDRSRSPFSLMTDAPEPHRSLMDMEESEGEESRDTERGTTTGPTATDVLSVARLDVSLRPVPPTDAGPISETTTSSANDTAEEQKPETASPEPHAVSILKSGVIDEMAYTLYSDGSIEAELPQGTMRFTSIMELRSYLEKSS